MTETQPRQPPEGDSPSAGNPCAAKSGAGAGETPRGIRLFWV